MTDWKYEMLPEIKSSMRRLHTEVSLMERISICGVLRPFPWLLICRHLDLWGVLCSLAAEGTHTKAHFVANKRPNETPAGPLLARTDSHITLLRTGPKFQEKVNQKPNITHQKSTFFLLYCSLHSWRESCAV